MISYMSHTKSSYCVTVFKKKSNLVSSATLSKRHLQAKVKLDL